MSLQDTRVVLVHETLVCSIRRIGVAGRVWILLHPMERERCNRVAECGIQVGILDPAVCVEKEISRPALWNGGGGCCIEVYGGLVAGRHDNVHVV